MTRSTPAPSPLTPGALHHWFTRGEHLRWLPLQSLEHKHTVSCIDGHHEGCIVGAPGGNMGEFILVLASLERVTHRSLTTVEVRTILDRYVERFGRFYMHTDSDALARLTSAMLGDPRFGLRHGGRREVLDAISDPPSQARNALLDLMIRPAHIGCGHLRALSERPEAYGVRPALVRASLEAFFELLWRDEDLQYVVLDGDHEEQALVTIDVEGASHPTASIPSLCASEELPPVFVQHRAARRFLLERSVEFVATLVEELAIVTPDWRAFRQEVATLAEAQLDRTASILMSGLPRYEVRFAPRYDVDVIILGPALNDDGEAADAAG